MNYFLVFKLKPSRVFRPSGGVKSKETLQKLLFPLGVKYSCKNEAFRTDKVNEVFQWISSTAKGMGGNKNGQTDKKIDLSNKVGRTRFELATPRPPAWCATGLRYRPINLCKSKSFIESR